MQSFKSNDSKKYAGDSVSGTKLFKQENGTIIEKKVTLFFKERSQPLINFVSGFYDVSKCYRSNNMTKIFKSLLESKNESDMNMQSEPQNKLYKQKK